AETNETKCHPSRDPAKSFRDAPIYPTMTPGAPPPMLSATLTQTLTFLFTDIEGSTMLWEQAPEAMRPLLAWHDGVLRSAIESSGGHVFKTTGDGVYAVFGSAKH